MTSEHSACLGNPGRRSEVERKLCDSKANFLVAFFRPDFLEGADEFEDVLSCVKIHMDEAIKQCQSMYQR